MIENNKPNLSFKTYSPITATFIMFIVVYGLFSFASDLISYLIKYYN